MFAAAFGIATFDAAYAQAQAPLAPCCAIVNGKYIDKTTGKEVAPSKAVPHVAAPETPCCTIVNGKYIDLKTGKEVTPPASAHVAAPSTAASKPPAASSGGAGSGGHGK